MRVTMRATAAATAFVGAAIFVPESARAQGAAQCAPRAEVLKQITERYGEMQLGVGLNRDGALLEIFASERGDTWTIIATGPNGLSCVLTAGESWQPRLTPPKGTGA